MARIYTKSLSESLAAAKRCTRQAATYTPAPGVINRPNEKAAAQKLAAGKGYIISTYKKLPKGYKKYAKVFAEWYDDGRPYIWGFIPMGWHKPRKYRGKLCYIDDLRLSPFNVYWS